MQQNSNTSPKVEIFEEQKSFSQLKWINDIKFSQSVDDFEQLTQYSFFDKTNFIKDFIFDLESVIQINRPRRWGKTLTLKMIKTFFQPHIDDILEFTDKDTFKYDFKKGNRNWKYFENLNISKDKEFIEKYFGQYPVLYVDLQDIGGDNESMVLKSLQLCISKTYHNHFYVYERLKNIYHKTSSMTAEFQIKLFSEYYQMQNNDLTDSLRFLSELLYEYFNKKVIVLIDEYDKAMMKLVKIELQGMENQQLRKWTSYEISSILGCLIKGNDKVQKALLTGVLDTLYKGDISTLIIGVVLSLEQNLNEPLQLMIGLTEVEIETFIMQKLITQDKGNESKNQEPKVKQLLKNIKLWYNGYNFRQDKISVFSPYSIGCYLQDVFAEQDQPLLLSPRSYWNDSGTSEIIKHLTELKVSQDFQLDILNFILGNQKLYRGIQKNFFAKVIKQFSTSKSSLALDILMQEGYFKISQQFHYEYANKDVEIYFQGQLIEIVCRRLEFQAEAALMAFLNDRFIEFEKEQFCSFLQEKILNNFPKSQQKVEDEFYFQTFFTCLSIYCYLKGEKVSLNAAPEYETIFNKKIDNVFFPTKVKGQRKLIIHEYKCTFQVSMVQSLLEKAIWQIYAKCYMSGFTKSEDWDMIVIRAFVFYQDHECNWHLKMKEYQHLNQVAQILIESCFLKEGKLLTNCVDLVEGKKNSRQQFLEQYGCRDFNDFIKYFDYLQEVKKEYNQQQLIQEDENLMGQFGQMKISEEKQNLFDRIGRQQLQQIEELLKKTKKYFKNTIQVENQVQLKSEKYGNKPISLRQMVQDDRTKKRKSEHEAALMEKRKIGKEEEQVKVEIQEEVQKGDRKEEGLEQIKEQESDQKKDN